MDGYEGKWRGCIELKRMDRMKWKQDPNDV